MSNNKIFIVVVFGLVLSIACFIPSCAKDEKKNVTGWLIKKTIRSYRFIYNTKKKVLDYEITKKFYADGRIASEKKSAGASGESGIWSFAYQNDSNGNQAEVVERFGSGETLVLVGKYEIKYDDRNNKVERDNYNGDGELIDSIHYEYNRQGNIVEIKRNNIRGELKLKQSFKYNDKSKPIECVWHKVAWKVYCIWYYKYDDNGNRKEWIWCDPNRNVVQKWFYKYGDTGNLIEDTCSNGDGSLVYTTYCKYDEDNKLIEKKSYEIRKGLFGGMKKIPLRQELYEYEFYAAKEDKMPRLPY